MRICLYVGKAAPPEKQDEWLANAKSTCDVYAANLHREFTSRGHEVVFQSSLSAQPNGLTEEAAERRIQRYRAMTYPEVDHSIILEQNGWRFREREFFDAARSATSGLMCAICDHDHAIDGPQDLIFSARRPKHGPDRARYVGWGADPDVFRPEKSPEWLTIFVDHKYDPSERFDDTEALLKSATTYAAELKAKGGQAGDPPRKVQVVFFSPDGIERIEPGEIRDVHLGNERRQFYKRVPGPELAAWARRTDIFVVTHGESMGLPVLENAMAGALIVARRGFVKPELLRPLAHVEYDRVEDIDWDHLTSSLDPDLYRRRALHFSWSEVAERMLEGLSRAEQTPSPTESKSGGWLFAPALPIDAFSSLSGWESDNIAVLPDGPGERLRALPAEAPRFVRQQVRKLPWPQVYTFSMQVRPNGFHNLALWLCGETDEERASVKFDLCTFQASPGIIGEGWLLLDSRISKVGEELLCQAVVRSDWAPVLRCQLTMYRGHHYTNNRKRKREGLRVSRISLSQGLSLASPIVRFPRLRRLLSRIRPKHRRTAMPSGRA